jgi:hypothetical protein
MAKFEIQTQFIYGWENVWEYDGELEYFDTYQRARESLDEFLSEMDQAYFNGDIEDQYDGDDYRIMEVK